MRRRKVRTLPELFNPDSPGVMEVYRVLTTIAGKGRDGLKSVLITSAMPREGKSILVAYLGMTAAHSGRRTLIIDLDLRRSTQHKLFGLHRSPGVGDLLSAEEPIPLENLIKPTSMGNLHLMPSGSRLSSPSGVLRVNVDRVKNLIAELSMSYDLLLVDSPPIVPVNDAELIAPLVDGVVLVVMGGKTFREIVARAIELIRKANGNLVGMVLNNVTRALPYYYEHKYYRYRYEPRED